MIQAIKASGVVVKVKPEDFVEVLVRSPEPLVVVRPPKGMFQRDYVYLTPYRGLAFYVSTREEIALPPDAEVVMSERVWVPA